jgi:hypothetical protein
VFYNQFILSLPVVSFLRTSKEHFEEIVPQDAPEEAKVAYFSSKVKVIFHVKNNVDQKWSGFSFNNVIQLILINT